MLDAAFNYVEPEKDYEIIEGVKCMAASATNEHNFVSFSLCFLFNQYLREHMNGVALQDVDVKIDENNTFRPDVSVIVSRFAYVFGDKKFFGAPDLVVEILSRSTATNDFGIKKNVYERCGVKEYWIVDCRSLSINVYHLIDGKYELDGVYQSPSETELAEMDAEELAEIKYEIKVSIVPDLIINVKDVFNFPWQKSKE